jgi:hypothetical protein
MSLTSPCLNLEDVHPHVEDENAQNHGAVWISCSPPSADVDFNCGILLLTMIMLTLRMNILYILYKEGAWLSMRTTLLLVCCC